MKKIVEIQYQVDNQGTVVQDENFPQVPVFHLTRECSTSVGILVYVGQNVVWTEKSCYLLADLTEADLLVIHQAIGC